MREISRMGKIGSSQKYLSFIGLTHKLTIEWRIGLSFVFNILSDFLLTFIHTVMNNFINKQ